jgi:hypothetical protein
MKQIGKIYAAFGQKPSGEWEQVKFAKLSKLEAEIDLECFRAWYDEAKEYVDFKIMGRKVTTIKEDWEDV